MESQPVENLVTEEDQAALISKLSGRQAESLVTHDIVFENDTNNTFLSTFCIAKA
jgi:hypothetical protein